VSLLAANAQGHDIHRVILYTKFDRCTEFFTDLSELPKVDVLRHDSGDRGTDALSSHDGRCGTAAGKSGVLEQWMDRLVRSRLVSFQAD
jgi:hypothetical protein